MQKIGLGWDWGYVDVGLYAEQVKAYMGNFERVLLLLFEEDIVTGHAAGKAFLGLVIVTMSLILITISVTMINSMVKMIASEDMYYISLALTLNLLVFAGVGYAFSKVLVYLTKKDFDKFSDYLERRAEAVMKLEKEALDKVNELLREVNAKAAKLSKTSEDQP